MTNLRLASRLNAEVEPSLRSQMRTSLMARAAPRLTSHHSLSALPVCAKAVVFTIWPSLPYAGGNPKGSSLWLATEPLDDKAWLMRQSAAEVTPVKKRPKLTVAKKGRNDFFIVDSWIVRFYFRSLKACLFTWENQRTTFSLCSHGISACRLLQQNPYAILGNKRAILR